MPGITQSWAQGLTEVATVAKCPLGDIRQEGSKQYRYVKLQNTTATVAVVAGDPVAYAVADTASEDSTVQVVSDFTDAGAVAVFAGVCVGAVAGVLATAYFIWIQTGGPCTSNPAVVGTVGQGIMIHATVDKTWAVGAAATNQIVAVVQHAASKKIIITSQF